MHSQLFVRVLNVELGVHKIHRLVRGFKYSGAIQFCLAKGIGVGLACEEFELVAVVRLELNVMR